MRASLKERILFWICDTFGHAKSGSKNTAWHYEGQTHYECTRCGRIVSTPDTKG